MAAYGLRAKIAPGVEINDIHIHLAPDRPPTVQLVGACRHAKTSRLIGTVTIDTVVLGPAGVQFINEMKEAFGGHVASNSRDHNERQPSEAVGRIPRNGGDG